jgi:hypothetical protein
VIADGQSLPSLASRRGRLVNLVVGVCTDPVAGRLLHNIEILAVEHFDFEFIHAATQRLPCLIPLRQILLSVAKTLGQPPASPTES